MAADRRTGSMPRAGGTAELDGAVATDPPCARHLRASVQDALMRGLAYRAQRQAGDG